MIYKKSFYITDPVSNNSFNHEARLSKKLFVPALVEGGLEDVELGDEVVFEDLDDEGVLRSCKGLRTYVKLDAKGVPAYVFDNHNHAFAFWQMERLAGTLGDGALLIHVDQHKDTRVPASFLSAEDARDLEKIFIYTNTVLNVGNFIPAAQHIGLVKDIIFIDSEASIEEFDFGRLEGRDIILDVDLDFFTPELDYIDNEKKVELIKKILPRAKVITFATSPFFIEQERALAWLWRILQ